MKYLIFGNGFLGNIIANHFNGHLYAEKLYTQDDVETAILLHKPEVVINCAGKTGTPNIDWCEENKKETFFANVILPAYMQNACLKARVKLVHIGSGCTYQGTNGGKGFSEKDKPNHDANYYAWSKIVSERYLSSFDVLQLRIRMPFHHVSHPRNLLNKILKYKKIIEAENSITYVPDLISALEALLHKNAVGVYNVVNRDGITHGRILHHYQKISGIQLDYQLIDEKELDFITKVPRSNCVLSVEKLDSIGIFMPSAIDAMERCIYKYCESQKIS